MKKLYILLRTTLLIRGCPGKTFRILKLITILLIVNVSNVFGGNTIPDTIDLTIENKTDQVSIKQQNRITGIVTDKNGTPLPGVNVVVTGTTQGAISDNAGKYSINIPQGAKSLTFSFIGMELQEINIGTLIEINVTMFESEVGLDEVVVVGYGSSKKSDLTGSVGSVSKKDMGDRVVSGLGQMIQGKVAGVDVTQDKIRIRGVTTFNNTDPLIVIDGFLGGSMSTVNPEDIESIEVLKDASSTAIYGARGANGVILVTTKSGKAGSLKTNINVFSKSSDENFF